jgi:ubiquinone/menaquinone biosynthesis C-methylase UbiE
MSNPRYCCPRCKGVVTHSPEAYRCDSCGETYPIIGGIADFRVYADPYIDLDADRRKGLLLAEKAKSLSFADLVSYYYSITPEVPADLATYYLNHHIAGITRGAGLLRRFLNYGLRPPTRNEIVLDLGCGTGGFLAASAETSANLIGVDIAFRWLIVARKRLQELGHQNIILVCACADYLPFPDNFADVIVAENLIEHVRNQSGLFTEIARVRRQQCRILARTVNRFAFGPEPHVGVWGVGYLPRSLRNNYVKLIKRIPYEHIHLQSLRELRSSVQRSGQTDLNASAAKLLPYDYQHHSTAKQSLFKLYDRLSQTPLRGLVTATGPYLDLVTENAARPIAKPISQDREMVRTSP